MRKNDRRVSLKKAVMYSNHTEEYIRLQIERGLLKKYDKNGKMLTDSLSKKGLLSVQIFIEKYSVLSKIIRLFINR
ncbi:MAG: hypothetical protein ACW97X_09155 [Candidatus Hodarchaeales archaeon]|jgi:hypothetical protein